MWCFCFVSYFSYIVHPMQSWRNINMMCIFNNKICLITWMRVFQRTSLLSGFECVWYLAHPITWKLLGDRNVNKCNRTIGLFLSISAITFIIFVAVSEPTLKLFNYYEIAILRQPRSRDYPKNAWNLSAFSIQIKERQEENEQHSNIYRFIQQRTYQSTF